MADKNYTSEQLAQKIGSSIVELLEAAENYNGTDRSRMVLDAAQAYRAVRGGAQPGSVHVEK